MTAPELTRGVKEGLVDCPDCGERATMRHIKHAHYGVVDNTWALNEIDCSNCEYYEWWIDSTDD